MHQARVVALLPSIAAISVAAVATAPRIVRAQNADAEALFNDGNRQLQAGNVGQACDLFEASNRIEPRAGTLLRLGECREKNHQLASAWSAYNDALARAKDPRKHDAAAAKVAELEPKLSRLTVTLRDDVRVPGLELTRNGKPLDPMLANRPIPVDGGDYVIVGKAAGFDAWTQTVTVPESLGRIEVAVPRLHETGAAPAVTAPAPKPAAPAVASASAAPAASLQEDDEAPQTDAPGMFTPRRKLALVVAAGGAAAAIGGVVLGLAANGKQNDAHALCPDPQVPCAMAAQATALAHDGHGLALDANIAFGVGAGAAIAAGILWFTGAPESSHRVAVSPSLHGVTVWGRF